MAAQDQATVEQTKAGFSVEKMLETRAKAQQAVHRIAAKVQAGMLEEDANEMVIATLREMGASKAFHKPHIRFGSNTTKTFGAASDPVWEEYEGDAGDTFVTGSDPELKRCSLDAKQIFNATAKKWKTEKATGVELYRYAQQMAQDLGWVLNLDLGGHRLGDYSSAEHYEGPLSEIDFSPSPNLWMVEIHIRHPEKQFGAFYEDLLV